MDSRITKHAEVLVNYSLKVKENEKVLIVGDVTTLPMLKECYRQILKKGAYPEIRIASDEIGEVLLKNGNEDQITYMPQSHLASLDYTDAVLTFHGASNTKILNGVSPEKVRFLTKGRSEYVKKLYQREADGKLRWCLSLYPTVAQAQEAGMSLEDYSDFVYESCRLNAGNPVGEWMQVDTEQERLCRILDTKKSFHIVSGDTDIRMSIDGRKWVNCSGRVNFPDGEIFTAPVEDTVEGHIRFSFPGIYAGNEIEDIRLTFEKGKVVSASARKGEELLKQLIETDKGASFVGEMAVGTNYNIRRFTRNMLFDEKIGGTVHMALGRSIVGTGGKNESAVHWDMICDMSKGGIIRADGAVIYENGKFVI